MSEKEKGKNENSVLLLNVRGTFMRVRLSVLQRQDSELSKLVETYAHLVNTSASIFIDRDYKIFSKLLDVLGETSKVTWSRALGAEADFWGIKLDGLVEMKDQHYLVVQVSKKTGASVVTDSEGQDITKLLEKASGLDYPYILILYAETFHYRITNFFQDSISSQIIVEMTAF